MGFISRIFLSLVQFLGCSVRMFGLDRGFVNVWMDGFIAEWGSSTSSVQCREVVQEEGNSNFFLHDGSAC